VCRYYSYYDETVPIQERGEETRTQILVSSVGEFARNGYDGTGIAGICSSAGVSKGAFYHHFESKQALFLELLDAWLTSIDTELSRIRSASKSTLEALVEMTKILKTVFDPSRVQVPVFIEFLTRAARDPGLRAIRLEPYRRYQRYFTQLIEEGVADGTLRTGDSAQIAQLLVSLAVGLVLQGVLDPESADWGSVAEDAVTLFIRDFIAPR
jgi:AcrR family transcriptional regulator